MDAEQSKNFNDRLSQWVANQGFWFQVRYSMAGSGFKGRAMIHFLRLGFRLLIFLAVVAIAGWAYLVKRADTDGFRDHLRDSLKSGLSASELDLRGGRRVQGHLEVGRLAAEGADQTFFSTLEARNLRCKMGLLDGLVGVWQPGVISLAKLDVHLRAGADDADSAAKLSQAVFHQVEGLEANSFEVADATVRWGYSDRTAGAIESSALTIQRTEDGWRLTFKGGTFHQNWLRKLEVVNLVVSCNADGLVFEKAELRQGEGTVDLAGLRIVGGERPQVQGTAKIRHLNLEQVLPAAPRRFLEGTLSGDFRVFGSTNSTDGIGFEGQVVLDGEDVITLREQIYLLRALSVVDYSRNYHRIDFKDGSLQIKTIRGGMELSDVKLKAGDLFTLEGALKVRLPTPEEIQAANSQAGGAAEDPFMLTVDDLAAEGREAGRGADSAFTLKRAAQEARRIKEGTQSGDTISLFDRMTLNNEMRRLQRQTSERLSRMLRYEGTMKITIPGDAFERGPKLQQHYPIDPASGRIAMDVPLDGYLYELTVKQAEQVYEEGQR